MSDSPGKKLKAAREARGWSIDDITRTTKMRPSIILSLEADDYTKFPSITHARNFLVLYSKHLKVDVTDGLNQLATPAKIGVENYQYLNVERHENTSYRPQRRMRNQAGPRSGQTPRILGIIAFVIVFLIVATYLAINLQRLNLAGASGPSEPVEDTTPAESTRLPISTPTPYEPADPEPSTTPFYAPINTDRTLIKKPKPTPF